jgi:cell division septum initiation protein DivIVA
MADTKKTTSAAKKPTTKKKPAAPRKTAPPPPAVTPEAVQSALSAARLAHEQVQYFERRLRSARSHDTLSLRKGLVTDAEESLAQAKATYDRLGNEYMALKEKLYEGHYQRRA